MNWPRSVSLLTLVTAGLLGCETKQAPPEQGPGTPTATPPSAAAGGASTSGAASPEATALGRTPAGANSSQAPVVPVATPSAPPAAASVAVAASETARRTCYPKAQVLLQLPPTWWLDRGAHIEGGRSRDLSFTADATAQVLWLMNESTQRIREYRAGKLMRELGPVPDGAVDLVHLGAERFALLYTEPAQVAVYDASTNQTHVVPAPNVPADAFLQLGNEGVGLATFDESTPLLTLAGQARRGAPVQHRWHTSLFHARELRLTSSSGSPRPPAEVRVDLGPGQWVRRGMVYPTPERGFLALGRAEPATRDTSTQYEDVFLLALDVASADVTPPLVALAPSEFGPPLRRPLLATQERLLQLTSDSRGTRVLAWPWPAANEPCAPRPENTTATQSAPSTPRAGALRDEAKSGCSVRWDRDWLLLRCDSNPAHPYFRGLALDEPFAHDYQARVATGSELRTETNGLVAHSTRTGAAKGADFVELGVQFGRGTRVSGTVEGKQTLRFELEWPQSATTLPQELGRVSVGKGRAEARGDH